MAKKKEKKKKVLTLKTLELAPALYKQDLSQPQKVLGMGYYFAEYVALKNYAVSEGENSY